MYRDPGYGRPDEQSSFSFAEPKEVESHASMMVDWEQAAFLRSVSASSSHGTT
jgi:hypothetical protein